MNTPALARDRAMDGDCRTWAATLGILLAWSAVAFSQTPPPQLSYLEGQTQGAVRDVAYTADGKLIVAVGADGALRIWDRASAKLLRAVPLGKKPLLALALSPDGLRCASGALDGKLTFCDLPRTTPVAEIAATPGIPAALALSADGKWLLSGDQANIVRLLDIGTKTAVRDFPGTVGGVTGLALWPDAKLVLASGGDGNVRAWNLENALPGGNIVLPTPSLLATDEAGRLLAAGGQDGVLRLLNSPPAALTPLPGHTDQVMALAVAKDGKWIISGGLDSQVIIYKPDGTVHKSLSVAPAKVSAVTISTAGSLVAAGTDAGGIRFWQTADGSDAAALAGHTGVVQSVAEHPTQPLVASSGADGTIRIWRRPFTHAPWPGHTQPVSLVASAANGDVALSASLDKSVRIWNKADGKLIKTLENLAQPIAAAQFSPDGKQFALGDAAGGIALHDAASGALVASIQAHRGPVSGIAYLQQGKLLATTGGDGLLKYWRLPLETGAILAQEPAPVRALLASADGKTLAVSTADGAVRLLDVQGKEKQKLPAFSSAVTTLASSTDRATLAAGSAAGEVRFWNFADGADLGGLAGHQGPVQAIALHPKLPQLATGGDDATIRLWKRPLPTTLLTLHKKPIQSLAVRADGKEAVTVDAAGAGRIWSLPDGKPVAALVGHTGGIQATGYRRDGQQIATGDGAGEVRLWNPVDGAPQGMVAGHEGAVTAVNYHPNNTQLATSGADGTVRIWQLPLTPMQTLAKHTAAASAIAVTSDGSASLSGGADQAVRVVDHSSGKQRYALEQLTGGVRSLAISPDNALAAAGTEAGVIHTFSVVDGGNRAQIGAHSGPVRGIAFKPQGGQFASVGDDGKIRLWETPVAPRAFSDHTGAITAAAISPSGQWLATADTDKSVRLWNLGDGSASWVLGHGDAVLAVAWKADSSQLATSAADKTVRVWNVADGKQAALLDKLAAPAKAIAFAADGATVYTAGGEVAVKQWKLADGALARTLAEHDKPITNLLLAGATLITASEDGAIRSWNSADGGRLINIRPPVAAASLAVTADAKLLAVTGQDKAVRVYNLGDGALSLTLAAHGGPTTCAAFTPDQLAIITGSADGQVRVWDMKGKLLEFIPSTDNSPRAVVALPDNRGIVVGGEGKLVRIHRRALVKALDVSEQPLVGVVYSADGNFVVTAGADKTVRLWNTVDGSAVRGFAGHTEPPLAVAITKDGTKVIAAIADKTVRVWNYGDGVLTATLIHPATVNCVGASVDGLKIISGGTDHLVRVWDLATQRVSERFADHPEGVLGVAASADGKSLFSACADGVTRRCALANLVTIVAHAGGAKGVAYSVDGAKLFSTGADKLTKFWDPAGKPLGAFTPAESPLQALALRGDSLQVAVGGEDRGIYCFRTDNGQLERKIVTPAAVLSLAYSADQTRLAAAGADQQVRVYNAADGMLLETRAFPAAVNTVAFGGDSGSLLVGGGDNIVRLENLAILKLIAGHQGAVTALAYTPDGAGLISGGVDKTVRHWNSGDGAAIRSLAGVADAVTAAVVSADGLKIFAAGLDKTVRIWNLADGAAAGVAPLPAPARSLALSPDGSRFAVGGDDGPVRIFDLASGKEIETLVGHQGPATTLSFAADNRGLFSAGADKSVRLWKLSLEKSVVADAAKVHALAATADGTLVVTSGEDKIPKLWDLQGALVRPLTASPQVVRSLAFRADGQQLAGALDPASGSPNVVVWNPADGAVLANFATGATVASVTYTSDGQVAAAGTDKHLRFFAAKDGRLLADIPTVAALNMLTPLAGPNKNLLLAAGGDNSIYPLESPLAMLLEGHQGVVSTVLWTRDGGGLLSAGHDKTVRLWEAATGKPVRTFSGSAAAVMGLALAPDGKTLYAACADNAARAWDLAAAEQGKLVDAPPLRVFTLPAAVRGVALSADGGQLITASDDLIIRNWDVASGKELERLPGHTAVIHSLAVTAAGQVFSASADKTLRRWPLSVQMAVAAHEGAITATCLSADGKTIFTAGADKLVKQWELGRNPSRLHAVRPLNGATAPLKSVAVSGDGQVAAAGGDDAQLRIWLAKDGQFMAAAPTPAPIVAVRINQRGDKIVAAGADLVIRVFALTTTGGKSELTLMQESRGHTAAITNLALGADERTLFSCGSDQKILRWLAADYTPPPAISLGNRPIYGLAYSKDGKQLAVSSGDALVRLLDSQAGKQLSELKGHTGQVYSAAFRPDGLEIATTASDGALRIWGADGKSVATLQAGITGPLYSVAWSSDGKLLQTGGVAARWQTFDRGLQTLVRTGEAHNQPIYRVAANATGTRLATLDGGAKLCLWDAAAGGLLFHQQLPAAAGYACAWSPEGDEMVIAASDSRVIRIVVPAAAR